MCEVRGGAGGVGAGRAGVQACRTCGVTKPLDGFGIRTYPSGWWNWESNCRECEVQVERARKRKRKGVAA